MIINIRGTSGAGKTTLVRRLLPISKMAAVYEKGRSTPLWYWRWNVALLGSYKSTCGGCDTIHSMDEIFSFAMKLNRSFKFVIIEGLLLSEEVNRTVSVKDDISVFLLSTPLEKCLENINERRRAKNPEAEPVNPKNTNNRHATILRAKKRLLDAGVSVEELSFEDMLKKLKRVIK